MAARSGWLRLLLALAGLQCAAGLAGFALPPAPSAPAAVLFPAWIHVVHIIVFGAAAGLLLIGGRQDRRAQYLGAAYLLFASAFAHRLIFRLATQLPAPWSTGGSALNAMRLDAFMPVLWWLFFREFPTAATFGWPRRLPRIAIGVSVGIGALLFLVNLAATAGGARSWPFRTLNDLVSDSSYWTPVLLLTLPAFAFAGWKARHAPLDERRRAGLFVVGLAFGSLPMLLDVLLETFIAPLRVWMSQPAVRLTAGAILYPLVLSIPFTTAYSVLVDQVLDVRLVLRRAIRYALARYSVVSALAIPFVALGIYLYDHRGDTIAALFSGGRPLLLVAVIAVGLVTLAQRRRLFTAIDRRFFREQYDARRILTDLADSSRRAANPQELASLLAGRVDAALHLESIAMLVADPATGQLVAAGGRCRPLNISSPLATFAAGDVQPLDIDLERPLSPFWRLPEADRQWLADGGFRLIVPFLASDGSPLGLLALGEKKSELPFHRDDRELLAAIAAASSLTLENRLLRQSPGMPSQAGRSGRVVDAPDEGQDAAAGECARCGIVYPQPMPACPTCGHGVGASPVPYVLSGKFRFERRVGHGGMGVVYRATDLVLQRPVAIKTLPRVSPEAALRLRREARAAARVIHPGLAQIFGSESWRGTPMLIFEFLDGGTLADRIAVRPLSPVETVRMGVAVAAVLERAHAAGILHGDIKPSNIGYRLDGSLGVLDFGVARMLSRTESPIPFVPGLGAEVSDRTTGFHVVAEDAIVELKDLAGTLAYVSPEALRGETADPAFDLWSLAVVLYEAITGSNPFAGAGISETMARLRAGVIPPVRDLTPTCPPELAAFVHEALHPDVSRRPSTAREFRMLLRHAGRD